MRGAPGVVLAGLTLATSLSAHAQDSLAIRATRRDTMMASSTVTAAFVIASRRSDSVAVRPRIDLPETWSVLTGATLISIAPGSTEMLILSVSVPARTRAGIYTVRVGLRSNDTGASAVDSVIVRVPERHGIDLSLQERPGYVVSGRPYDASFLVRNRGNVATAIHLSIRSTLGTATLADSLIQLGPDEARVVRARVAMRRGLEAAMDDVLEIAASRGAESVPIVSSARVTVVPEPSRAIEEFQRIPVRVNLRAASSSGVSPLEILGQGLLRDGGSTKLEFVARAPTGRFAAFGDREEYRVDLYAPSWSARAGDQVFMLSPLTGAGQPGFGLGADVTHGMLTAGAHGQQFRRSLDRGSERGAFVGIRPFSSAYLGVNGVDRVGGFASGQFASSVLSLQQKQVSADVEVVASRNGAQWGRARSARFGGALRPLSFDAGHIYADTGFAGSQRGAQHDYFTARSAPAGFLSFGASGSDHRADLSRSAGAAYLERFRTAAFSATAFDRYTIELGAVSRGTTITSVHQEREQRAVRARADHDIAVATLAVEVEAGRAGEAGVRETPFHDVTVGMRRALERGHLGGYFQRYSGGGVSKGDQGTTTIGGDASIKVSRSIHMMVHGYSTRQQRPGAGWNIQLDALASHTGPNGNAITLRARLLAGGALSASEQMVAYLEYGIPLRVPVSRLRTPGRVFGRVVDAASGRGVPGALVRLGPQVAITDRNGQVAFGNVPGGEHRLSMSQETSFANAVFIGDPTLRVDSTRAQPTTFSLAIASSARVDVNVRRFITTRTAVGGATDSLSDAGAVSNVLLILAGERDTLYRTTGEDGKASFTDIPPGKWTIAVRGDTPAFTRFDPDRVELVLEPAETRSLALRLVPRKREIQMIGDGQELRATTSEPKAPQGAAGTRTVKPRS